MRSHEGSDAASIGKALQPLHDLRMGGPAAGGIENELLDRGGTMDGEISRDPAAQRFTADHRLVPAEGLDDREHVVGVVLHLIVDCGLVGPTVAEHVDGDEPEMIGMRAEVSGVRLGVAADAMQRQDERLGRVAGLDAAGPDSAGVDVVLLEGNAPEIGSRRWKSSLVSCHS